MAFIAKNVVIDNKKKPEPKVQTYKDVKLSLKKQSPKNPDLPLKSKKRDDINKRKQESQFLSVMKNKE